MAVAMYLDVFSDNPFATNCWLLASEEANEAVVIDPGFFPDRVLALLRAAGKRPSAVLATHGHIDHIGAAAAVCGTELPLYIHKEDELALTDPEAWGAGSLAGGCLAAGCLAAGCLAAGVCLDAGLGVAPESRPLATICFATKRQKYALLRSTFDGSLPLNAPPP